VSGDRRGVALSEACLVSSAGVITYAGNPTAGQQPGDEQYNDIQGIATVNGATAGRPWK